MTTKPLIESAVLGTKIVLFHALWWRLNSFPQILCWEFYSNSQVFNKWLICVFHNILTASFNKLELLLCAKYQSGCWDPTVTRTDKVLP